MRFIDRVHMPVEPVVDRLAGGTHKGARQRDPDHRQQPIAPLQRDARGHHAASKRPHRREPGDGLEQLGNGRKCGAWHHMIFYLTCINVNLYLHYVVHTILFIYCWANTVKRTKELG